MTAAAPREQGAAGTVATLALISGALPLNLLVTGLALALGRRRRRPAHAQTPRTILVSGGKMTKALHLARAFHRAGHRVILVEAERYRLTGHRFSRAVDRFVTIPAAGDPGYAAALVEIVRREGVDVYVPVCSPASARDDALAKAALEEFCEVLHFDPATLDRLDDKHAFAMAAREHGLAVPDAHRITDPEQVTGFDFDAPQATPPYVLKSIAYDPVRRLDLTPIPQPDPARTRAFVEGLPIGDDNPWVMQAFVGGQEYCTHSTARDGRVQLHCCCESSAFQLNYAMVDVPEIEAWVRRFVDALGLTGQVSLDFIRGADGRYRAIECNPRTHSAITMFYDHPGVAHAFLDASSETITPTAASRPTYWLYHELWRMLTGPGRVAALRRVLAGKEAIFSWDDPLPFLMVHHAQIPSLLWDNLRRGRAWLRVDFNIGKLIEPGGDWSVALRVLHLVGSAQSEGMAELSRLYARDCLQAIADHSRYEPVIAEVSPDRRWRFPVGLDDAARAAATPLTTADAIVHLAGLRIDLAIPQMFCLPGMTEYRALLDLLGIPYIGNRPATMALGAHKARAKAVVAAAGVAVPAGEVVRAGQATSIAPPAVVKPVDGDNSDGLTYVRHADEMAAAVAAADHGHGALVEEYVALGREVRCGVIERDGELIALPLEEYAVSEASKPVRDAGDKLRRDDLGALTLVAKQQTHAWIVDIEDPICKAVWAAALRCHVALGCRHYSLFDFRIDASGRPWFLEAGLYCSFAHQSVVCAMARAAGLDTRELFALAVETTLSEPSRERTAA